MLNKTQKRFNIFMIVLLAASQQIGLAIITPSLPQMGKNLELSATLVI
tara:strand:+ start:390 stop:533 length:144 start_codon:yes stop_codon:yes gene_type:complete